jgi:CO/xanthine dehydrogenase Mo-binding subunit
MMNCVAYKMNMDPVEFALKNMKNMTRKSGDGEFTNPVPIAAIKRGAGMAYMAFRSGFGRSNTVLRVDFSRPMATDPMTQRTSENRSRSHPWVP